LQLARRLKVHRLEVVDQAIPSTRVTACLNAGFVHGEKRVVVVLD
jgi:hypothetical protein